MKHLKPYNRILALFFASTLLGSCTSVAKFSSAKTIDITPSIVQKPTVADLVVKEVKVSGEFTGKNMSFSFETIKTEAVAAALKTVNADILVEPRFETNTNGKTTTVKVSGFPATFKNFRTMKTEDIPLMQLGVVRQVSTFSTPVLTTAKSAKTGNGLLIALGVIAVSVGLGYAIVAAVSE